MVFRFGRGAKENSQDQTKSKTKTTKNTVLGRALILLLEPRAQGGKGARVRLCESRPRDPSARGRDAAPGPEECAASRGTPWHTQQAHQGPAEHEAPPQNQATEASTRTAHGQEARGQAVRTPWPLRPSGSPQAPRHLQRTPPCSSSRSGRTALWPTCGTVPP